MRIVIAGPPKTGNMWLKCLLGRIYQLRWLKPFEIPETLEVASFRAWVEAGRFADGTIFHRHYAYSPEIADAVAAVPAHLVTIIRDPYDAFVSSYFTMAMQSETGEPREKGPRVTELSGKPLDHPDVVAFLRDGGYRNNLQKARDWARSGRAVVARYEDLSNDPLAALRRLTEQIAPVDDETLTRAIDFCRADRMRERTKGGAKHVRQATVGDSLRRLNAEHYAAFRDAYGDIIQELGYPLR